MLGNTPDIVQVDEKSKSFRVTKTNDNFDVVSETKSGESGSSLKKDKDGNVTQYKKGEYQKSLQAKGYNQKPELRGAQSEEFALEMLALDGAGKAISKAFGWAWSKVFGASTEVAVTTSTVVAAKGGHPF
ncbi:MAG: hypothetical protein QM535_21530 [Limnohabitans sp.]|nr:hypothetical protein [Limnohabitans sp.]